MEFTQKNLIPHQEHLIEACEQQTLKWEPEDYRITPDHFKQVCYRQNDRGLEEIKREDSPKEFEFIKPQPKHTIQPSSDPIAQMRKIEKLHSI